MPNRDRERKVITAFCQRLSTILRQTWDIVEWPEQNDIDAVLTRDGHRAVLDHTVLNSFSEQRRLDAEFSAIATPLEKELKPLCIDHFVRVMFHVHGLPGGRRDTVREHLKRGLAQIIPHVPADGEFHGFRLDPPGCEVRISKEESRLGGCYFARLLHDGHHRELEDDLVRAIRDKSLQLSASRGESNEAILLLETVDISTINEIVVCKALAKAALRADHSKLDAVFLFDDALGDLSTHMVWPLKYRGIMPPDYSWMDEFRRAQGALVYGWNDRGPAYVDERNLGNNGDWTPR